ncbi:MAG: radical SAM protein [Thermoleophilia bacterium]
MRETASEPRENRDRPSRGWKIARRNFGDAIFFFAPALKHYEIPGFRQDDTCRLQPVSITGGDCQLMCDHCRAGVLERMRPARTPEALLTLATRLAGEGVTSLLLSGGSDRCGVVPLKQFTSAIARIRDEFGIRVIVHAGIVDAALAGSLQEAGVEAVLIDIPGDDATISGVLHLDGVTTDDYAGSLADLCDAGLNVVPHVVIGLDHGRILGESAALRMISEHPVRGLVLVGLRPLAGTPMASVAPPEPGEMAGIFHEARELFPETPVMLGCERPGGEHKEQTDILALEAGINGIAFPADGVIARARELGLKPRFSGNCCAAPFADLALGTDAHRPEATGVAEGESR